MSPDTSQPTVFQILDQIELASEMFSTLSNRLWPSSKFEYEARHRQFIPACEAARIEICQRLNSV